MICDVERVPGSFQGKVCDVEQVPGSFQGRICAVELVAWAVAGAKDEARDESYMDRDEARSRSPEATDPNMIIDRLAWTCQLNSRI